uniref:Vomeronasal 2, receptor 28 n=1 Tax=Mus musculus TaxID=10090 RepID=A0A3B2WD73_MOUSE
MFILVGVFFLLKIQLLMANYIDSTCFWRLNLNEVNDKDLDQTCSFILGAVQMPMEKDYFKETLNVLKTTKNHKYALALAFSMDEINRNPDLLPNMSLIIKYNLGRCDGKTMTNTADFLDQKKYKRIPNYFCNEETMCSFLLTGPDMTTSLYFQMFLDIFLSPHFLQLTYGPFSSIINDSEKYPYVYQMAPKDTSLALAMVYFILYFQWNWVGLIIPDDEDGYQFLSQLKKESKGKEICFAFVNMIGISDILTYATTEMNYNQIMMSSTNVIIIYGETNNFIELSFRIWESTVIQRIWVTTIQLNFPTSKKDLNHGTFYGTFTFLPHHAEISGYKKFVQTLFHLKSTDLNLEMQEWKYFNCEDSACNCKILMNFSSNASLDWLIEQKFDITFSDGSQNIYNAVHAMAHALHETNLQQVDNQAIDNGKLSRYPCFKMPSSVCSADCGPGFRRSRKERVAACCFICSPCPENEISNETNMDHCVNCPEYQYANTEQNKCIQKAVIFLSYEDPLGMALALMAFGFSAFTALVLWAFVKHHDTPIVKANNRILSYLLLMSLMFCFLCTFFFIGHPNRVTCVLQQITFGIVFTVAVSTVLAKTITVILAFKFTGPGRTLKNILVSGTPNYIIPICSLFQCILCAIWLAVSPPFVDIDEHSEHGNIILVCNKGSVTAFYCVLGYLACLALGSFTVAFLARNLPDAFNEAKFLTFSMLVFCSVWVTFLPVYHSTKGKVMVAVEIFSILASSSGILGCIFAPKIYIIFLRPERNSIKKIREKSHF